MKTEYILETNGTKVTVSQTKSTVAETKNICHFYDEDGKYMAISTDELRELIRELDRVGGL